MSPFKQALGNAKLAILFLLTGLFLSFFLNVFLGVMLYMVPKHMTVFVPAHIGSRGFETKANQISDSRVYRFTYSTWVSLNSWSGNGAKIYPKKLAQNAPFLTKPFLNTLKGQMSQMSEQGFLFNHSQVSYGVNGASFNKQDVKYIGNNTWLVHLNIRTINYVSSDQKDASFGQAHVASDAKTSFIFKVSTFPIIPGYNTSGLVLSGFGAVPKVIKVYQ